MSTGLECPACGSDMPSPKDRFWCPRCRAFFCTDCIRKPDICPNCGRRAKLDAKLRRVIYLLTVVESAVAITGLLFMVYLAFIDTTPTGFGSIADVRPGQVVRLYGVIDAPNWTAFVLNNGDNGWTLKSWEPFHLADPNNISINISINLSSCDDFYRNAGTGTNDAQSIYRKGDDITVVGKVELDTSGERVLRAESIRASREDSTNFWDLVLFVFILLVFLPIGIMMLLLFSMARTQQIRHRRFLESHPSRSVFSR